MVDMTGSSRTQKALRITRIGIFANLCLIVIKFAGGLMGKSGAVIADAVHSFADFATDIIVIIGLKLADKPADNTHHYGHGKFETLSSLALGIILMGTGIGICWAGAEKVVQFFHHRSISHPNWIAFLAASVSVVVKEWMYIITYRVGKQVNSQSLIANAINHRSDALSSLGVMLGIGGAVFLGRSWFVLDPIAAFVVGVFIFKSSFSIIKQSLDELLESSLGDQFEENIRNIALRIPGVKNPHHMKTRKIGNNYVIDFHIDMDESLSVKDAHDITEKVEEELKGEYGPDTVISIHVEPEGN
jgi:cation diffusion facilitator family transporter